MMPPSLNRRKWNRVVTFGAVVAVGLLIAGKVYFGLRHALDDKILGAHTAFAFQQIRLLELDLSEVDELRELVPLLESQVIDWKSCAIDGDEIRDGWGRAVELLVEPAAIRLRSAGPDGSFGTSDDIVERIGERPARGDTSIVKSN